MSSVTFTTQASLDAHLRKAWKSNLVFIWVGVFVGLLGANFVFPFLPFFIRDELGVSDKAKVAYYTGLCGSVTGLSPTLTAPIWGGLADRYGRRPMFLRALVGAGVLIGIMGIAQAVWQLLLLRFAMGAFAGTMGAAAALVAATTPREKVGQALGTLQTGVFTANMLGPFVGGIVAANLGIRESFLFCAILYGLAAVAVFVFVHEPKVALVDPVDDDSDGHGHGKPKGGSIVENLKVVVSERQVVLMLGLLFSLWLGTTFVRPVMPLSIGDFANDNTKLVRLAVFGHVWNLKEAAATGVVFGVIGATSTVAAIVVAPLGSRLGYRNTVAGAALLSGIIYIPVALAGSFLGFCILLGSVGLFQGAMVPGTNALIAASTPDGKQGSAFGLAASMQSLALLIGPLAGGFVSGTLGGGAVYVVIGAILIAASIAAVLFVREPKLFSGEPSSADA